MINGIFHWLSVELHRCTLALVSAQSTIAKCIKLPERFYLEHCSDDRFRFIMPMQSAVLQLTAVVNYAWSFVGSSQCTHLLAIFSSHLFIDFCQIFSHCDLLFLTTLSPWKLQYSFKVYRVFSVITTTCISFHCRTFFPISSFSEKSLNLAISSICVLFPQ